MKKRELKALRRDELLPRLQEVRKEIMKLNAQVAVEKGRSAAVSRRSTKNFEDHIAGGRMAVLNMPVLPIQGGLPIMVKGECVGGVGISGVQSHEDEQIAQAGLDAVGS